MHIHTHVCIYIHTDTNSAMDFSPPEGPTIMLTYTCMYIHNTHVCIHTQIYVYTHRFMYIHTHVCIYIHTDTNSAMDFSPPEGPTIMLTYTCMYIHNTHVCIYTQIYVYTLCTYTCTYTCIYIHTDTNSAMDFPPPEGPTIVLTCFDENDKMLQRVRVSVNQKWSDMQELAAKSEYVYVCTCVCVYIYICMYVCICVCVYFMCVGVCV